MDTIKQPASPVTGVTNTILAIDLGKDKSVTFRRTSSGRYRSWAPGSPAKLAGLWTRIRKPS